MSPPRAPLQVFPPASRTRLPPDQQGTHPVNEGLARRHKKQLGHCEATCYAFTMRFTLYGWCIAVQSQGGMVDAGIQTTTHLVNRGDAAL